MEENDEDRCRSHALAIASKALCSFRSLLNREYVQTGRTPFKDYNMIKKHVWDEFVELMSTDEAKAKAKKFKELAKRNELPHNLGMTGYAFHIEEWQREEREAAEAEQPSPLMSINERSRNYLYARRLKKRKEGSSSKYNKLNVEEVEKMLDIVAAKRSGSFQPRQERDALTKVLGNPEHRD
jgi:hypothetical protein